MSSTALGAALALAVATLAHAAPADAQFALLRDGFESGRCAWNPPDDASCGLTATQAAAMLARHNEIRAAVVPAAVPALPPLQWSPQVASIAQAWANNCICTHNPDRHTQWGALGNWGYLGENIAWGGGTPTSVVTAWASESSKYDYATNICSSGPAGCLHYTAIVARVTTHVGCGRASCGCGTLWVCDYAPMGNVGGGRPY